MCGRFEFHYMPENGDPFISEEQLKTIRQHAQGEIFPSQPVLIFYVKGQTICAAVGSWGFRYQKKRMINARLETLQIRRMFAPYAHCRCVLPCDCYYEWCSINGVKQRMRIAHPSMNRIYLAGIYNEQMEVCVLTTKAIGALASIHDRMPIVLDAKSMQAYLAGRQGVPMLHSQLVAKAADRAL